MAAIDLGRSLATAAVVFVLFGIGACSDGPALVGTWSGAQRFGKPGSGTRDSTRVLLVISREAQAPVRAVVNGVAAEGRIEQVGHLTIIHLTPIERRAPITLSVSHFQDSMWVSLNSSDSQFWGSTHLTRDPTAEARVARAFADARAAVAKQAKPWLRPPPPSAQTGSSNLGNASPSAAGVPAGYETTVANVVPGKPLFLRSDLTLIGTVSDIEASHRFPDGTTRDAVLIHFSNGTSDWVPRSTVHQLYVTK